MEPPRLIDGEFVNATTLELLFNEPLAPADAVDPNKWRLSMAYANEYYYYDPYTSTIYADPGIVGTGQYYCWNECWYDECYEYCYWQQEHVTVTKVTHHPSDPARIRLTLSHPMNDEHCDWIAGSGWGNTSGNGFHVHYSNNGSPHVTDLNGNALDAIAEHWVLSASDYYDSVQGSFPSMPSLIPIACP